MANNETPSRRVVSAAFAIGRTASHITCTRCKGTGWWQLARVCFKCGGKGNAEKSTLATRVRDKRAHIAEVTGIIADEERRIPALKFGKKSAMERLESDRANLARLIGELAELEGAA